MNVVDLLPILEHPEYGDAICEAARCGVDRAGGEYSISWSSGESSGPTLCPHEVRAIAGAVMEVMASINDTLVWKNDGVWIVRHGEVVVRGGTIDAAIFSAWEKVTAPPIVEPTPGPWFVDGRVSTRVVNETGRTVCSTGGTTSNGDDNTHRENEENAKLIAKLPHIVEALTPSSDTKAAYMGEFWVRHPYRTEGGKHEVVRISVPWTEIKKIMAAIRRQAGLK